MSLKPRWLRFAAIPLALGMFGAACGGGPQGGAGGDVPRFVSIATGGTGGAYYPIGGAMGSLLGREIDGLQNATAEATGGSVENIRLLHDGQAEMAIAQGDAVHQGCNGEGDFEEPQNIATIALMYVNLLQITYPADRGINRFEDLAGKRVSVGDAGSATEVFMRQITEFKGMSYDDFAEAQRLPFDDQVTAMRNNQLDVGTWVVAPGVSSIQDLASSEQIQIMEFSEEDLKALSEKYPYYFPAEVEGGTYQGLDEPVTVPGTWNSVVVSKDLGEDFVYQVTKALHENVDALAKGHPAAGDLAPENIENALCPLHPGAMRYFEEQGVEVPEDMRPTS
ncbi:MAG: TAXI family TRAP transporter solute-binding subunit [Streptosporangiales bacterium]|nr:TAXI family TRAP transporter solute-binding subunit [Streptosporangiales bacterium]